MIVGVEKKGRGAGGDTWMNLSYSSSKIYKQKKLFTNKAHGERHHVAVVQHLSESLNLLFIYLHILKCETQHKTRAKRTKAIWSRQGEDNKKKVGVGCLWSFHSQFIKRYLLKDSFALMERMGSHNEEGALVSHVKHQCAQVLFLSLMLHSDSICISSFGQAEQHISNFTGYLLLAV